LISSDFNIARLFRDVVDPQRGEEITFIIDHPHGKMKDNAAWADRRQMAADWYAGIKNLCAEVGAVLNPIVSFPATGANNADLPVHGEQNGRQVVLHDILKNSNVCFALTEYSATAPLSRLTVDYPTLRAASLPGVNRGMEKTALAANYAQVAKYANLLAERLNRAETARVVFSTGHEFTFDLRFRTADVDDGYLHADKTGMRVINLPSGEACIVPYEGERKDEPSRTAGQLPVQLTGEIAVLNVEHNRIIGAEGASAEAQDLVMTIRADRARQNIAELGLGCNPSAVISGKVLEDEKVGFHWAYGRSEHLGGVVGPEQFAKPENILHVDIVYARGCPIGVVSLTLTYPDGAEELIIKNGEYTVF
jgi:hypothetical protein